MSHWQKTPFKTHALLPDDVAPRSADIRDICSIQHIGLRADLRDGCVTFLTRDKVMPPVLLDALGRLALAVVVAS